MPDVTIVIPNYNGIAYLGACLRSVEKQEGVSAEVLIVDNGSTDGSQEYNRVSCLPPDLPGKELWLLPGSE